MRVDLSGVTDLRIGSQAGISAAESRSLGGRLTEAVERLEAERREGRRPFLDLAGRADVLASTLAHARDLRGEVDRVVLIACEGSALGASLLADALAEGGSETRSGGVALRVVDGADAAAIRAAIGEADLRRTLFHVISRTGENVEALAAFLIARAALLRELGAVEYARHLLLTTDADAGPLRQIVNDEGLPATEFPPGVAGHQSATSPAHLLAAALLGVDLEGYLAGAGQMDERCRVPDPETNPAAALAAAYYLLATLHGIRAQVLLVSDSRLRGLSEWWRHAWAATLGKRREGESGGIAVGVTPVAGRATIDHYTQMQMLLDGPADKGVTIVRVAESGSPVEIPRTYGDLEDVGYLGGRTVEEIGHLEHNAVVWALARAGRPVVSIALPTLSAHALGQVVRLFEATVLLCASLHDVDPQARPAVEGLRRIFYGALGKPGFEAEGEALRRWMEAEPPGFVR